MTTTLRRIARLLRFSAWALYEIVRAARVVLIDVLTPGSAATPRLVRLPLGAATDAQATVLAALITLTPGTLTVGALPGEDASRALLVHSMYHPDEAAALAELQAMQARVRHAMPTRPRNGST